MTTRRLNLLVLAMAAAFVLAAVTLAVQLHAARLDGEAWMEHSRTLWLRVRESEERRAACELLKEQCCK